MRKRKATIFYFAISAPLAIGANTTVWFNTDLNAATGYQIFGSLGGAEYNLNIKADGTAALYTGAAGRDPCARQHPARLLSRSPVDRVRHPEGGARQSAMPSICSTTSTTASFVPANYSAQPYVAYDDNGVTRTDPTHRIGIVYSATTAANYFSATAYAELFMAAQNQAMQAGISFDLLTEADLTNLAKLANYDALVFPSFTNVQAADVAAITNTLLQATRQFGVGLITSGELHDQRRDGSGPGG